MSDFTERQLKQLKEALQIAIKHGFHPWDIASLQADIEDYLQFEREAKRQRKKSLVIERRIAGRS